MIKLENDSSTTPIGTPPPEASPEVKSFYERYGTAMHAWFKEKGNTNFPIIETPEGKLIWVNRDARKKNRKRGR